MCAVTSNNYFYFFILALLVCALHLLTGVIVDNTALDESNYLHTVVYTVSLKMD